MLPKQSRSKEQSLGKLMKIYVAQMLLRSSVQSCQEQGINLLAEFLIKLIRQVGSHSKRIYELQGRQEGNIFHVLLALDRLQINPTIMLHYFKNDITCDSNLNRVLKSVIEQTFKEKFAQPEQDETSNLRQKCQLQLNQLSRYKDPEPKDRKDLEALLSLNVYFKNQSAPKGKKELTEKEFKEEKRKFNKTQDEESYARAKEQQKKRKDEHQEFETINPFNVPLKKHQLIEKIEAKFLGLEK